jgi:hypothetical protein
MEQAANLPQQETRSLAAEDVEIQKMRFTSEASLDDGVTCDTHEIEVLFQSGCQPIRFLICSVHHHPGKLHR